LHGPQDLQFGSAALRPACGGAGSCLQQCLGNRRRSSRPLLKDLPLVRSLDANLAGRYTDYSTSGTVQTWKIGLVYNVIDELRFRGTTSVDIRAPTLNDMFQQAQVGSQASATSIHRPTAPP